MSISHQNSLAYFGAAGMTLWLTPILIRVAKTLGLVDKPHARKVHRTPVPRIGGLAIAIGTLLPFIFIAMVNGQHLFQSTAQVHQIVSLLIGAVCILLLGIIDDVFDLRSTYKLLAVTIAAAVFCGSGGTIQSINMASHHLFDLGIAAVPVTMLWIVGVTVSVNFIDGLDGLAAGIAAVVAVIAAIAAGVGGLPVTVVLSLCLCGALCAFLVFNYHPAKIFMGDCGSMFIAFVLAGDCVIANHSIGTTRSIILPAMALSIPIFDTFFTMLRRGILERRSLFAPERGHIHHRLLDTGLCHQHAVMLLHGLTLAAAVVGLICIYAGGLASTVAAVLYVFVVVTLFRMSGSVRGRETVLAIRRNRAITRETRRYQAAFHDQQLHLREVETFDAWWEQLCLAADKLDFAKVDLPLVRRDGTETIRRWRRDGELLADAKSITAEVPIPQRRTNGSLRAHVEVLVPEFLESGGLRLALFARLIGECGLNEVSARIARRSRSTPKATTSVSTEAGSVPSTDRGPFPHISVAIVHDFLYTYAGAERVLEQFVQIFPQAEIFSLFDFLPDHMRGFIANKKVRPSFIQRMPFARRKHRMYLPLMPLAIEQLDVSQFDLVISSSYMAAKGVITRPDQLHICYCHTPVRFAWDLQNQYLSEVGLISGLKGLFAKVILHYIRNWDVRSANGVDVFVTNSDYIGRRIQKVYRRSSTTVHPPVDVDFFAPVEQKEDFYLTVSRLVPYKRIELVIEAFNKMPNRRLLVCGDGPDMPKLKAIAGPNVTMLGHETTERVRQHMQLARAFVFAAEEDFGIVSVEAQACGTPVIAFARGGATESVIPNETGVFFHTQTVQAITEAVEKFESLTWDSTAIRHNAERFSAERFRTNIIELIRKELSQFKARQIPLLGLGMERESIDMPTDSAILAPVAVES